MEYSKTDQMYFAVADVRKERNLITPPDRTYSVTESCWTAAERLSVLNSFWLLARVVKVATRVVSIVQRDHHLSLLLWEHPCWCSFASTCVRASIKCHLAPKNSAISL